MQPNQNPNILPTPSTNPETPQVEQNPMPAAPEAQPAAPASQAPVLPAALPAIPDPVQPAPPPTVQPASPAITANPALADDVDVIEKEWVDQADKIISQTKDDPFAQEEAEEILQIDYLKKRYGHDVKKTEES